MPSPNGSSSARDKAQKLVNLAADKRTPEPEAFAAAMAACRIIDEHDLLAGTGIQLNVPDDVRESIEAVTAIYNGLTDPKFIAAAKKIARTMRTVRKR
jgi:hypothetical protein